MPEVPNPAHASPTVGAVRIRQSSVPPTVVARLLVAPDLQATSSTVYRLIGQHRAIVDRPGFMRYPSELRNAIYVQAIARVYKKRIACGASLPYSLL